MTDNQNRIIAVRESALRVLLENAGHSLDAYSEDAEGRRLQGAVLECCTEIKRAQEAATESDFRGRCDSEPTSGTCGRLRLRRGRGRPRFMRAHHDAEADALEAERRRQASEVSLNAVLKAGDNDRVASIMRARQDGEKVKIT